MILQDNGSLLTFDLAFRSANCWAKP